jgi:hypothetical protein
MFRQVGNSETEEVEELNVKRRFYFGRQTDAHGGVRR